MKNQSGTDSTQLTFGIDTTIPIKGNGVKGTIRLKVGSIEVTMTKIKRKRKTKKKGEKKNET